jgi:hypothetical protein
MIAPTNYDEVKALAKKWGRPASTLIALSHQNDPFYIGPDRLAKAEWFAKLWKKYKVQSGVHLRRLHYLFVSQRTPIRMLNGKPYKNTLQCWDALGTASRDARYLDLVSADDFVDRRNAEPIINIIHDTGLPEHFVSEGDLIDFLQEMLDPPIPYLTIRKRTQRYQIEIWAEKSTMNDVLAPIAERYGITLITGVGELSATHCNLCINRAIEDGRPVRILYISDFDPGGLSMPVAAARKIEWFNQRVADLDLDIQLRPIVLTLEQCRQYHLPRTPIKDTELRATHFEERFGEGATELDALEALHPGVLAQIVEGEIDRYYDSDLDAETEAAARPIRTKLAELNARVRRKHAKKIEALQAEYADIIASHDDWNERANVVWRAIKKSLEAEAPDIVAEADWPEPKDGDEDDDPLFDSTRDYVEQIDNYKAFQGKPTSRAKPGTGPVAMKKKRAAKKGTTP